MRKDALGTLSKLGKVVILSWDGGYAEGKEVHQLEVT